MVESPSQNSLEQAIAAYGNDKSEASRAALLRELPKWAVGLALRDPVPLELDEHGGLLEDTQVVMLSGDGPHGPVLMAFTSEEQMKLRSPEAYGAVVPLGTVFSIVVSQGYAGVLIDPSGVSLFISGHELGRLCDPAAPPPEPRSWWSRLWAQIRGE